MLRCVNCSSNLFKRKKMQIKGKSLLQIKVSPIIMINEVELMFSVVSINGVMPLPNRLIQF